MTTPLRKFERILDPSAVMELGYAAHVADDPLSVDTSAQRLAARLMDDLMGMRAAAGSDDEAYLFKARGIVLSLGRGIGRRKQAYRIDADAADDYRALEMSRIDGARAQAFWTTLIYRAAVSGGIGFALMESLLPFVHLHFEKNGSQVVMTGLAPSLLLALIFAASSKVAFSKLDDHRHREIFRHYEWIKLQALHCYEAGKLKEFERSYVEIKRLWRDYTGHAPPRSITFAAIIAEDIRTQEWLARERRREMAGTFAKLLTTFRDWRSRRAAARPAAAPAPNPQDKTDAQPDVSDRPGDRPGADDGRGAGADLQPVVIPVPMDLSRFASRHGGL